MNIIHPFDGKQFTLTTEFCGKELKLEYGRVAFLAGGAVIATYGDTVVLGIANAANKPDPHLDYFPLSIEYEEKMYASGKISGSRFIKREGRPSDDAILTARLIDRPIRPLFPKSYKNPVQGVAQVLSLDPEHKPDTIAMIAISAAISLTGAPFDGPVAGVRIGLVDGELVAFPKTSDLADSDLDLIVAGKEGAIMMVEAGANEVSEDVMVDALVLAQKAMQPAIDIQKELVEKVGVVAQEFEDVSVPADIVEAVDAFLDGKMGEKIRSKNKLEIDAAEAKLKEDMLEALVTEDNQDDAHMYKQAFSAAIKNEVRRAVIDEGIRPDMRSADEVRPLSSQVRVLPRTHGSAIFTRGSTQALNITTLAPLSYAQIVDTMEADKEVSFFLHYNMAGYTVGEIRRIGSPGRREIGHGHLAQRAIAPMMPNTEDFPYTVRVVAEMTTSNGSTSMATVCSSVLSLMDAGVPLKRPVSGIAMGLMTDGKNSVILSDIQGTEDFAGDMDFKVTGTTEGITALQMDMKVHGLPTEVLKEALMKAKAGRAHILEHMVSVIDKPAEMSPYAPRIETIEIPEDKIRDVIGKGGETINKIIDETGAEIDIRDGGVVNVSATDKASIEAAIKWIKDLTAVAEVGKIYEGEVVKIMEFGAFVNIMPGQDGLVHISEMSKERVGRVEDVVSEGDFVKVKLTAVDEKGRLNLSMKAATEE